jgi:hypothetical protein
MEENKIDTLRVPLAAPHYPLCNSCGERIPKNDDFIATKCLHAFCKLKLLELLV